MNNLRKAEAVNAIKRSSFNRGTNLPFYFVLTYLFLEFGRPQDLIPGLSELHLPAIVTILLMMSIVFSGKFNVSDKQTKLFVILLVLMAFHVPLATNNYWAFHIARTMLLTFVIYLSIITFVDSFNKFKTLIRIWIGIHIYLAIIGLFKGGRGIGGFLGDENDFCMTLDMVIPYCFFMALGERKQAVKIIYIGIAVLFLSANMLTLSRGGFVGLVGVGMYCWLKSKRKIVAALLVGLLALAMVFAAPEKYWSEIKSIEEQGYTKGTGEERVYTWKFGWKMFLDNPIIGVGQGNFPWRFGQYEGGETLDGRSRAGRAAHSLYFTLFPELGIVGTLIFIFMLYYTYQDIRFVGRLGARKPIVPLNSDRKKMFFLSLAMGGSLIGFLTAGIFISILYYPSFWVLMGFVVALRKLAQRELEGAVGRV